MELILLLFFISGGAYSQGPPFGIPPGTNAGHNYVRTVGEKYISEMRCIKKLHDVVQARWIEELNNVPITEMDNLSEIPDWEEKESNFPKYDTYEDEWLMESGSSIEKIGQCMEHLVSDIGISKLSQDELECIKTIYSDHALYETYHQRDWENLINSSSTVQLPFRKFLTFREMVDVMYQGRKRTDWTKLEGLAYDHLEFYIVADADKDRRQYLVTQNCDWVSLKALQDTRNEVERIGKFKSQVVNAVKQRLAAELLIKWNLNTVLPRTSYFQWFKAQQDMISQLEREAEKIRNQSRDALWICEYATELAKNLTDIQLSILLTDNDPSVQLDVFDATPNIRVLEQELIAVNDSRRTIVKRIADRQEVEMRCLSSLLRLVQNHRRYELAISLIDKAYEYGELYCKGGTKNVGIIEFIFCQCSGTICVSHPFAALFAEEYVLVKNSIGLYKVVRAGFRSNRKVMYCHTLSNSSRNL